MKSSDAKLIVECASLAPSVHNTQPWRFEAGDDHVDVRADRSRALGYLDPTGRQLHVSCGAAIEFARLTARATGHECSVALLPDHRDADLLARVAVGAAKPATEEELALAEAMARRYTDRTPYDGRPVPEDLLRAARADAVHVGAWLRVIDQPQQRVAVVAVLAEAEAEEAADPRYAEELEHWLRAKHATDGIPVDAALVDWPAGRVSDVPLRDFSGHGAHPHPGGTEAPPTVERDTLVLVGTETDDPAAWLRAGRALALLLLRATVAGVSSQPLGPAIDLPSGRARLRRELNLVGHPQFLLRLGYGSGQPRAGRRRAAQTLTFTT